MTAPRIPEHQRQEIAEAMLAIQQGLGMPCAAIDTRTGEQVAVVAILLPDGALAPVFQILPPNASEYIHLPGLTQGENQ